MYKILSAVVLIITVWIISKFLRDPEPHEFSFKDLKRITYEMAKRSLQ